MGLVSLLLLFLLSLYVFIGIFFFSHSVFCLFSVERVVLFFFFFSPKSELFCNQDRGKTDVSAGNLVLEKITAGFQPLD